MKKLKAIFILIFCMLFRGYGQQLPKPTKNQLQWQERETTAFLHFTVNTFTDKEWGDGTESPEIFNPVDFDAKKIIRALKAGGMKMAIITAKHHDGFCLWPSKYTEHSVKNSPWKNGKGDVVKEIADACRLYGLKFGVYLSPWDRHEATYGTSAYNDYYKNLLRELLTNYGEISEVWFDGAKGANAKDMQYDFYGFWQMVRELQPKAVMFSDIGPDVRWVGNEKGVAGETNWSMIDTVGKAPGKIDSKYLNSGDIDAKNWMPAESDVSIRPGWFYHPTEDDKVKTGKQLVDLYYLSVGRNSELLLNIPPNRQGLISDADAASLVDFRSILNETFKTNLARNIAPVSLTDKKLSTYVELPQGKSVVYEFNEPVIFDRAMFQENIADGQRAENATLEYWDGGKWIKITDFTTIGYKRLLRFDAVETTRVRVSMVKSKLPVELAEIGFFKASSRE